MKQTIMIIALAVIVVTAFLWYRSCDNSQVAYWEQQYNEMVKENELTTSQFMNEMSALQEQIEQRDETISALNQDISETYSQLQDVDDDILKLEEEYTQLGTDKDSKIDNLQQQIVIYKEKCTDLQNIIGKKDNIILNLQEKYDIQVNIANDYRSLYENELRINWVLKKNLSVVTKQHEANKTIDAIKNAIILSAIGYITYDLVKD